MPLKILTICGTVEGEKAYADWIESTPGIKILTRHVCPHEGNTIFDRIYIFYESAIDTEYRKNISIIEQNSAYEMCRDIAKAILKDENYKKLKNKSQRNIYMLAKYNLPKDDAETVDDLLQMAGAGVIEL